MSKLKLSQKTFNKQHKKEEKYIEISDKSSDGSLKIEGFTVLESIDVKNFKSVSFRIINCPQLTTIHLSKLDSIC